MENTFTENVKLQETTTDPYPVYDPPTPDPIPDPLPSPVPNPEPPPVPAPVPMPPEPIPVSPPNVTF